MGKKTNPNGKTTNPIKLGAIINVNEKKLKDVFNYFKNLYTGDYPKGSKEYPWKLLNGQCNAASPDVKKINELITFIFADWFDLAVPCFIKIGHELSKSGPPRDFTDISWEITDPEGEKISVSKPYTEGPTYW